MLAIQTTTMSNTADDFVKPDHYRLHTEHLMKEFFAVRTLARAGFVAVTPVLDDIASVIASELLSHAPDVEEADELRSQFALVLTWKVRAIINGETPDENRDYPESDSVCDAARLVLGGAVIVTIDHHPLI